MPSVVHGKLFIYLFGFVAAFGVAVAQAHILARLHDLEVARVVGPSFAGRLDVVHLPAHSS
jgi:hypothetical protein